MSLDWYPGQKCTLIEPVPPDQAAIYRSWSLPIPEFGAVYTITWADACPSGSCGVHIALRELTTAGWYPSKWFKPVEPKAMDVLRALLTPLKDKIRKRDKEKAT